MKVNAKTGEVSMAWRDRRAIVLHRCGYICEECRAATATEVDHIWPRVMGGRDDLDNLRGTCVPCNRSKGGTAYTSDITYLRAHWTEDHKAAAAAEVIDQALLWSLVQDLISYEDLIGEDAYAEAKRRLEDTSHGAVLVARFLADQRNLRAAEYEAAEKAQEAVDAANEVVSGLIAAAVASFDPDELEVEA